MIINSSCSRMYIGNRITLKFITNRLKTIAVILDCLGFLIRFGIQKREGSKIHFDVYKGVPLDFQGGLRKRRDQPVEITKELTK